MASQSRSSIQVVVPRRELFPNCPICHDILKPNTTVAACVEEHSFVHAECREMSRRCPSMGCARPLRVWSPDAGLRSLEPPREPVRLGVSRGVVAIILGVMLLVCGITTSLVKSDEHGRLMRFRRSMLRQSGRDLRRATDQIRELESQTRRLARQLQEERTGRKAELKILVRELELQNSRLKAHLRTERQQHYRAKQTIKELEEKIERPERVRQEFRERILKELAQRRKAGSGQ